MIMRKYQNNIKMVGVGGCGCGTINRIIAEGKIRGIQSIAINTDQYALLQSEAHVKIRIGGNGIIECSDPGVGRRAAESCAAEIARYIEGADIVFLVAGMGGNTGTGAAPIVAQITKELGILTIGFVMKPFTFEGNKRTRNAERGICELLKVADSLVIIKNDKLLERIGAGASIIEAFELSDDVVRQGVIRIADFLLTHRSKDLRLEDIRKIIRDSLMQGCMSEVFDKDC
jgi:cell division protein FtsZ